MYCWKRSHVAGFAGKDMKTRLGLHGGGCLGSLPRWSLSHSLLHMHVSSEGRSSLAHGMNVRCDTAEWCVSLLCMISENTRVCT